MPQKCPQCGASLPTGALAGLCPACLLQQGAAADTATHPPAKPFVPPAVEEVARLFPQLEILGFLGKGGMGAVYKARQPALDRLVALKILPIQTAPDPGFADRFTREARALARLSHPNIVAVHEFGQVTQSSAGVPPASGTGVPPAPVPTAPEIEGVAGEAPAHSVESPAPLASAALPYFIMEFVDGVNLRQLQKAGRLSPREALQIIPQICDALQYAHDEGVVHRDIKPENVLVDRKGRVKIADFGLAKILGRDPEALRLTGEGQVMGTPHYMAPEQIEHPLTVDHRADIFSLGVVFYEMLTGELPLGRFQPPSRKVQVDVRLDEVVLHALEKEPELRYQHASEVKSDVETITSSAPPKAGSLTAPPPMISAHDRRGGTRSKLVLFIVLFTAGVLALLLGLAAILLLARYLSASQGVTPPPGLVGWWRGEGNARDSAGTKDSVLQGGTSFAPGEVGLAFSFDGINDFVTNAVPGLTDIRSSFTMEFWAWPKAARPSTPETTSGLAGISGQRYAIFPDHGVPGFGGAGVSMGTNGVSVFEHADVYLPSLLVYNAPIVGWTHIAVVYHNNQPALYINGALVRTGLVSTQSAHPSTCLGEIGIDYGYYAGLLDEVSIYDRALSDSEIQAIFKAGHYGKRQLGRGLFSILHTEHQLEQGHSRPLVPPGLVSWWRGEGDGSDSAGTNNGAAHGDLTFSGGEVGRAFSFDGSSAYISVPPSASLNVGLSGGLTIEGWISPTSASANEAVFEWNNGQGQAGVHLWLSQPGPYGSGAGSIYVNLIDTRGAFHTLTTSSGIIEANGFQHVALTYDKASGAVCLYHSGALAASELLGSFVPQTSYDFYLGHRLYSPANLYEGMMDEVSLYNRALSPDEIQAIYAAGHHGKRKPGGWLSAMLHLPEHLLEPGRPHPEAAIVKPGLVSWWRGEGNASDSAGTNNGVLLGEATFAPGKVGQAFSFDPDSGTVVVPDSPSLQLSNELTIEAWINAHSISDPVGGYAIVSKLGIATGNNGYQFLVVGDTLQGLFNSPGLSWPSQRIISGPVITTGVWYHVAFTYDQSAMKLYCNGQVVATSVIGAHPIATTSSDLRISGADDHCYFDGLVDEASVYNRALSATEIQAIFAAGQNGKRITSRGPLGALLKGNERPESSRTGASQATPIPKRPANKSGPVARWHADGNGSDSVGKHHALSLNGVGFAKGVFGQAFSFTGDGVSVNIPYSPDLDVGDEVTVEFWMKADPDNEMRSIQGLVATEFYAVFIGGGGRLGIGIDSGLSTDGGATWATTAEVNGGGVVVSSDQWHHIAATYDGTKLQLYVDGRPSGNPILHRGTISPMREGNFLSIGSEEGRTLQPEITHNRYFSGLIDEVAIYNRALSAEEIAAICRTGKAALTTTQQAARP